ncbi:hypothetical protein [Variovorax boronicumulans]|uniref:hypothetical protein n=1 Tax=Variovorax boronicumulans TaxID=436515 RepID=UPI00277D643D|nr:hypothetical protein [Variovorax boronicumulans]MDQ0042586.1 hypothetical protein [Variovorax boronicumulans]
MISDSTAYNVDGLKLMNGLNLALPKPQSSDWKYLRDFVFKPRISPVDTKVQCKAQDSGSSK